MTDKDLLLQMEIDVIIRSIYNVCLNNDIAYLLPPAYKWLSKCIGWKGYDSWTLFTERYHNVSEFREKLVRFANRNKDNRIYQQVLDAIEYI